VVGVEHDVGWFEVAVGDVAAVRVGERVGELLSDRDGLVDVDRAVGKQVGEGGAVDELEDEVGDAVV
jgi:hypothetical protein